MDAVERALVESTVRDAIDQAVVRDDAPADVDNLLAELGWLDLLADEPRDAVDIVFGALGAACVSASPLDDVMVVAAGLEPRRGLAVLLPSFARWDAPGSIVGARVDATGLMTSRAPAATEVLVVGARGGDASDGGSVHHLALVPATSITWNAVVGLDPAGGLHHARVHDEVARFVSVDPAVWDAVVASGRRALARQLEGGMRTMLALARTHALAREQFGRPVARFQAVRHRLAEALVAVEALDATIGAAWDDGTPMTAALAKAAGGRAARTVSAHCQQVLAGIGFTTEHPFHRYLKRSMVLEGLLGTAHDLSMDLGRELLSTRSVPTLIEL